MAKFKHGDRVKKVSMGHTNGCGEIGEIGMVVISNGAFDYINTENYGTCDNEDDWELVEKSSSPNWKVGDFARIVRAITDADKIGQIRRVTEIKNGGIYLEGCSSWNISDTDSLRKASEREYMIQPQWETPLKMVRYQESVVDVIEQCQRIDGVIKKNKPKTFMSRVSIMMKKLLDVDTQKLVKAGLINGDLMPTHEGFTESAVINFMANKAALVERADEIIAEMEKQK